jgi:hypothetical protein
MLRATPAGASGGAAPTAAGRSRSTPWSSCGPPRPRPLRRARRVALRRPRPGAGAPAGSGAPLPPARRPNAPRRPRGRGPRERAGPPVVAAAHRRRADRALPALPVAAQARAHLPLPPHLQRLRGRGGARARRVPRVWRWRPGGCCAAIRSTRAGSTRSRRAPPPSSLALAARPRSGGTLTSHVHPRLLVSCSRSSWSGWRRRATPSALPLLGGRVPRREKLRPPAPRRRPPRSGATTSSRC